ncbi:hypothetical protein [Streptomyces sp. NPDC088246]
MTSGAVFAAVCGEFAKDPQGRYSVDQAHHVFCLWVSALLITLM